MSDRAQQVARPGKSVLGLHRMRVSPRVANRALLVHASGPCRRGSIAPVRADGSEHLSRAATFARRRSLLGMCDGYLLSFWDGSSGPAKVDNYGRVAGKSGRHSQEVGWLAWTPVSQGARGLEQGNIVYRLRSVVSHIGETAASGHYVAYRPRESHFLRFDDSTVSTTKQNPGTETLAAGEKVYIVCYNRVAEVPVIPVVPASYSSGWVGRV